MNNAAPSGSTTLKSRRIAFFDSGQGGLTVWESVVGRHPHLNTIYLGDNARYLQHTLAGPGQFQLLLARCVRDEQRLDRGIAFWIGGALAQPLIQAGNRSPVHFLKRNAAHTAKRRVDKTDPALSTEYDKPVGT